MKGLLYKDFVAVKGKLWMVCLAGAAAVLAALFAFSQDEFLVNFSWYGIVMVIVLGYLLIIGRIQVKLLEADEGKKRKSYLISLPVSKNAYVASKYLFLFFGYLFVWLINAVLLSIVKNSGNIADITKTAGWLLELSLTVTGAVMLLSVVEMPFFIGFGAKRGTQIKTAILLLLFFLVIAYALFGNLRILERFSLEKLMAYWMTHKDFFSVLKTAIPCVGVAAYYLSYKISCTLFAKGRSV